MSDTEDIYFALQTAKQAVESLASWQRRAEARDTVRGMAGEISRGMDALERLKSQLRDGRQHIKVPEDFKATGCMCSWPTASPPCSWCTDPSRTDEADEEAAQAETAQAAPVGCQCPACTPVLHASDCAVHNAPAMPVGPCNCGAAPGMVLRPAKATKEMMVAAVKFANGDAVYKVVAAGALEIEEQIYGEIWETMLAAATPGATHGNN